MRRIAGIVAPLALLASTASAQALGAWERFDFARQRVVFRQLAIFLTDGHADRIGLGQHFAAGNGDGFVLVARVLDDEARIIFIRRLR